MLVGGGLVYKDYQKTKQQVIANQQNIQIIVDFINKSIEASKNPQNMVQ